MHVAILDRSKNPVPQGVAGELYLSGVCLGLGYLNDEEKTKAAFVVNSLPEIDCGRLYKTGDLVRYLSDGNIEFLGRIDHQVKIRGFRIEPGEIETALRDHNAVQEAVVIAIENGSGGKRLVGYVVSGQAPVPTAGDLRDFLKQSLPEYMVPSTFMFLDSLPLTAGGKLDRKALPPPDLDGLELEQTFIAPRTPIEEKLAEIWSQVLKLERVGVNDNFFELGGHSLLATQLMSRIRSAFQMDLPLRSLFASPTVAHLSETIVQSLAEGAEPDETENMLSRIESLSLNEAQHLLSHEDSTRAKR